MLLSSVVAQSVRESNGNRKVASSIPTLVPITRPSNLPAVVAQAD